MTTPFRGIPILLLLPDIDQLSLHIVYIYYVIQYLHSIRVEKKSDGIESGWEIHLIQCVLEDLFYLKQLNFLEGTSWIPEISDVT